MAFKALKRPYENTGTLRLEYLIKYQQGIQKRNMPNTKAWKESSKQLAPMFEEMATRAAIKETAE